MIIFEIPRWSRLPSALCKHCNKTVSVASSTNMRSHLAAKHEVESYLRMPQNSFQDSAGNDRNILSWWRETSSNLPYLSKTARQFYLALHLPPGMSDRLVKTAKCMMIRRRTQMRTLWNICLPSPLIIPTLELCL